MFAAARNALPGGAHLNDGLSTAVAIDDTLWLTHDETLTVERLRRVGQRDNDGRVQYAGHRQFALADFLALPVRGGDGRGKRTPEADIEGLAFCDGYLWLTGSHAARRGDPEGGSAREAIEALAKVSRAGNRYLLARIPLTRERNELVLRRRAIDGAERATRVTRVAAMLAGDAKGNALTDALGSDEHLARYLAIPSKDNGFDVEGLAAAPGGRLFLGLRGPLLNGWACVLEVGVDVHRKHADRLILRALDRADSSNRVYRKHFLDLAGASVRDLCWHGRDLLILSGPPMRGAGPANVWRWRNALATRSERVLSREKLECVLSLPYREKHDHPEGMTLLPPAADGKRALLIVHDSAGGKRRIGRNGLLTDAHPID